ncbi:hypothetical protein ACFLZV_07025 [Candidatus Margulisiibacteriota bacterium]
MADFVVWVQSIVNPDRKGSPSPYYQKEIQQDFLDELEKLLHAFVSGETYITKDGKEIDLETLGGMQAVPLIMEMLSTTNEAGTGLTNMALKNENKFLTMS